MNRTDAENVEFVFNDDFSIFPPFDFPTVSILVFLNLIVLVSI